MSETLGQLRRRAGRRLEEAGVASAMLDARLLLAVALGASQEEVIRRQDDPAPADAVNRFEALVARRASGEPLAHLTGRQEFWSLSLEVTPATLIPRADSETLIEAVLAAKPEREAPLRILDLGTGSGCLLLALLSEYRAAWGLGVDRSFAALDVAARNADLLGVGARAAFVQGSWADAIDAGRDGGFDVVVSNPPYIPRDEIAMLQPEVRDFEPRAALDGGADGLEAIRAVVAGLGHVLAPGGVAAVELGAGQADRVTELAAGLGDLALPEFRRDLEHHRRCAVFCPS